MKPINKRIAELRRLMNMEKLAAYVVPTGDYHSSEYAGEYFKEREFITGFTGSAGVAVIGNSSAGLWTDGRYFLQAEEELEDTCINLFKMRRPGVLKVSEFLAKTLGSGARIGFDGKTISAEFVNEIENEFSKLGKSVSFIQKNLVNEIWGERPKLSCEKVEVYPENMAGRSREEKLQALERKLEELQVDTFVLSTLDDIAYLLNIRGNDVQCSPMVLSYFVMDEGAKILFAQKAAFHGTGEAAKKSLEKAGVELREYDEVYEYLKENISGKSVAIDIEKSNYELVQTVAEAEEVVNIHNYSLIPKYIKNITEIENMVCAHLKDGVAVTKWIYWLKRKIKEADGEALTEISVAEKLYEFRSQQENFRGESFEAIMGYGPHGAIVHYCATSQSNAKLEPKGLLLADTGGQYLEGTTDVTRTIALGSLSEEEKKHYTGVLCGHLALQQAVFKEGTSGAELDQLARKPIRAQGLDFNHGTGHGVGVYLNCHEEPVRISFGMADDIPNFAAGMITSDEPGIYIEGKHGIRIENLLVCMEAETGKEGYLKFEPLTLIPYEIEALDLSIMDKDSRRAYNEYQALVYERLSPYLKADEKEWLKEATRKI